MPRVIEKLVLTAEIVEIVETVVKHVIVLLDVVLALLLHALETTLPVRIVNVTMFIVRKE